MMSTKFLFLSLVVVPMAFAAVPSKSSVDAELEILALPLSNQKRLLKSDQKTLDRLVAVAQDTNLGLDLRWKSIMALGFLESKSVNPSYMALQNSKEWFVKNGLLIAMNENAHPLRFNVAKKMVKDPSLIVRSSAFDILMQEPVHRDILWEELFNAQNVKKKRSLWVRPKIISYMNQNPKTYERAFFEKLMKESEPEITRLAEKGLQKIKMLGANQVTPPATKAY
ncbi:MAG: hypothetical protein JNM24_00215 [Bdellovibrionaceae bacterium]|nr:hypothetical protein [Pseudobdellovibrionaceae bacterium]